MNLNPTQQSLAAIAACTAKGNLSALQTQLNLAFDSESLTVEQAKSALEQLYAYCGFPRSLNALGALLETVRARHREGKNTEEGRAANRQLLVDPMTSGEKVQTELVGQKVSGPLFDFSPEIDRYLKAHLFGDIFADDRLSWQAREIVTIAALGSMSGVQSQLDAHIKIGKNTGLNDSEISAIQAVIRGF